jgi:hypothetical protein
MNPIIPMQLPASIDERIVSVMLDVIANLEDPDDREHFSDLFVGRSRWTIDPDDATVHVWSIREDDDDLEIADFPGRLVGAIATADGIRFER